MAAPEKAGEIFVKACVNTEPTFKGAHDALLPYPFTQNSETGTYFHNVDNLSVKVRPGECSLVFATLSPSNEVVEGLANGAAAVEPNLPKDIDITSNVEADGKTYFRLGLKR